MNCGMKWHNRIKDVYILKKEHNFMKYKTKKNLSEVWHQLDDACGLIDNAITNLCEISNLPEQLQNRLDEFDLMSIVSIKNEIEKLIGAE
jgi:hypothetical protein